MSSDPVQRLLLALILVCLGVLVWRDVERPSPRYEMRIIQGRQPKLVRMDTATGRAEQLELGRKHTRGWSPLGEEPAPEPAPEAPPRDETGRAEPPPEAEETLGEVVEETPAGAPELVALGSALAAENPSQVRIWAAEVLGGLMGPAREEALRLLVAALEDPEPAVLVAASRSLAGVPDPEAQAALGGLLEHPDADVRLAAREALGSPE